MEPMKLGYLALSKASWMTPKIERITAETLESLRTLDAEILFDRIVTTEAEARAEARRFSRAGVDAVILHTVTFPVGATIPAAAQEISAPILLLANPEEPGAGGTWEQNSFCGVNMAAHGRRRGGEPRRSGNSGSASPEVGCRASTPRTSTNCSCGGRSARRSRYSTC